MTSLWSRFVSEESGAIAIIVAIAFPVFLLSGVIAVDISRWNVDKRQLQTQADAAVLAAGSVWQFPCDATAQTAILNSAKQYAGDPAFVGTRVNTFKDLPDAKHHVLYNSPTYYLNRTKPDPGAPTLTGKPCTDNAIDVKVTQQDVSAFFGHFLAKDIDATARAELKTASSVLKSTPIGVPLPEPSHVYAQFVNQSSANAPYSVTGTGVLADGKTFELSKVAGSSNPVLWRSPTVAPTGVQAGDKIGIRAVLDANSTVPPAIDCTAAGVECDSNDSGSWGTLMSARQWPQTSPDSDPVPQPFVKAFRLSAGACPSAYFADVPVNVANCKMDVSAKVKFNSTISSSDPGKKQAVTATINGTSVQLDYVDSDVDGSQNWQKSASLPVTPNSGRSTIDLEVDQGEGNVHGTKNTNQCPATTALCKRTFTDAQRVYGANSLSSGYIQLLQIDQIDPVTQATVQSFANSLPACSTTLTTTCAYSFRLTIGVATLHIAVPGERPTTLRILKNTTGNASTNGSLNCDTAASTPLATEIANGCDVAYRIANGNECDSVGNYGDMAANPPNPYPCVATKGGEVKNAVNKGMKDRLGISGNNCSTAQDNQWTTLSPNDLSQTDKRRIGVFLTDFGMFTGSGRNFIPVRGFAEFYVTGWSGQEKGNPDNNGTGNNNAPICSNNDPVPSDDSGYLVGHFIKDIAPPGVGDNGQACDPTSLDLCTAVLTR
jgi:hypothetical protein